MKQFFSDIPLPVLATWIILGVTFLTGIVVFGIQWSKESKNKTK